MNRIGQIGQLAPILVSKPTPSNFLPQITITQKMLITSIEKELLSPELFNSL